MRLSMFDYSVILEALKIIVLASVLFVWFIRYDNIVKEFKEYHYPDWLRDLVGILKISFVIMIQSDNFGVFRLGCIGLIVLMSGAFITHIRIRNTFAKALPSLTLLISGIVLLLSAN